MNLVVKSLVSKSAVGRLCVLQLQLHGPLSETELGRLLGLCTGTPSLARALTLRFGGLWQFLKDHPAAEQLLRVVDPFDSAYLLLRKCLEDCNLSEYERKAFSKVDPASDCPVVSPHLIKKIREHAVSETLHSSSSSREVFGVEQAMLCFDPRCTYCVVLRASPVLISPFLNIHSLSQSLPPPPPHTHTHQTHTHTYTHIHLDQMSQISRVVSREGHHSNPVEGIAVASKQVASKQEEQLAEQPSPQSLVSSDTGSPRSSSSVAARTGNHAPSPMSRNARRKRVRARREREAITAGVASFTPSTTGVRLGTAAMQSFRGDQRSDQGARNSHPADPASGPRTPVNAELTQGMQRALPIQPRPRPMSSLRRQQHSQLWAGAGRKHRARQGPGPGPGPGPGLYNCKAHMHRALPAGDGGAGRRKGGVDGARVTYSAAAVAASVTQGYFEPGGIDARYSLSQPQPQSQSLLSSGYATTAGLASRGADARRGADSIVYRDDDYDQFGSYMSSTAVQGLAAERVAVGQAHFTGSRSSPRPALQAQAQGQHRHPIERQSSSSFVQPISELRIDPSLALLVNPARDVYPAVPP